MGVLWLCGISSSTVKFNHLKTLFNFWDKYLFEYLTVNPTETAPITCGMHCRYWEQTTKFLQLCKNCIMRWTWCHENDQKILLLRNGKHNLDTRRWREARWSLLQTVKSNFHFCFSARSAGSGGRWNLRAERRAADRGGGGMVFLEVKRSLTRWCMRGVLCHSLNCRFYSQKWGPGERSAQSAARTVSCTCISEVWMRFSHRELFVILGRSRFLSCLSSCLSPLYFG